MLSTPFHVEAIYAGMQSLATDEAGLNRLRSKALVRAAKFSWRTAAAEVLDIYQMLLEQYPRISERKALLGAVNT